MYINVPWRHNQGLEVLADVMWNRRDHINKVSNKKELNKDIIKFHREGERPQSVAAKRKKQSRLLGIQQIVQRL